MSVARPQSGKPEPVRLDLAAAAAEISTLLAKVVQGFQPRVRPRQVGLVSALGNGVALASGLASVQAEELVRFPDEVYGLVFNLEPRRVGIIMLGDSAAIKAGSEVKRTGRVIEVPVGEGLLGRVVDALGRPLDGKGRYEAAARYPVERAAPAVMDRAPVTVPLATGLKVVDALIPIGRGQRELILGDRQTGKTALALDAVLNQQEQGVICVYCAIGQRSSAVAKISRELRDRQAAAHTIFVLAAGEDPPGMRYLAPYAATAMAEYFMDQGRDVLIVYDDLTQHALAYRELSLLLKRPPGREAFPGDIFYIHSRLLERATHLVAELGGGSLTALPIIETEAQNVAAYIPTNLISITDGQIYLAPELFRKGVLPAIDPGKSVSRVGGKAQYPSYRAVAGNLRLAYAQFVELEKFARFSTRLDEATRRSLERGRRVREILKQQRYRPLTPALQIVALLALNEGLFDAVPLQAVRRAEQQVGAAVTAGLPALCALINQGGKLAEHDRRQLLSVARESLATTDIPVHRGGSQSTKTSGL